MTAAVSALPALANTENSTQRGGRRQGPRGHRTVHPHEDGGVDGMQHSLGSIQESHSATRPSPHSRSDAARGTTRSALSGASLAFRPSSVAPAVGTVHLANGTTSQDTPQNAYRSGARSKRSARGARQQSTVVDTRRFGGSLTHEDDRFQQGATALRPSAVDFVPDQTYMPAPTPPAPSTKADSASESTSKKRKPQRRRLSKSSAPDLPTRIHEDIDTLNYECAICTSEVVRKSRVWSCHMCWTVFHLDCIKKWSSNRDESTNHENAARTWRCPGCNLPQDVSVKSYHCWCEKEHEPRPVSGIPPHSCGSSCGRTRLKCPHPCALTCHAGPCPPCTYSGSQRCFCGKESATKKCSETMYDGWSCGQACGELLPCGEHYCSRGCHTGLCGACEVKIEARCYCGLEDTTLLCSDKDDERSSKRIHVDQDGAAIAEEWVGVFQCSKPCDRLFDCLKHRCSMPCHASDHGISHCPRSPDVTTTCPCGKTLLSSLADEPRRSCEDPIPSCSESCGTTLICGHQCTRTCHTGECPPCTERFEIPCRCGRTSSRTICHQGSDELPQCFRICRATLGCGRHECGERCCSGERKAVERLAHKRKHRPLNAPSPYDDGVEAEHICTRICQRPLSCGNHFCEELCHKGPCKSCPEAIFEEISCNCGRTILQPPLPCGTKAPACRYQCGRPKTCGHPQVNHTCHGDDESCPKCPFLVDKVCLCGKRTVKHQQCWFADVRCGDICGRKLRCGTHTCRKLCHRPGECEDQPTGHCSQACGRPKSCGHPDEAPCHAPYPCKEETPCPGSLIVTCACQHIKKKVRCQATATSPGNAATVVVCTDECARVERNRKLALALDIDPATHTDDNIPYSAETMRLFDSLDHKWLTEQEREFRVFAQDADERRVRFKPMPASQRAFIHSLAEDFGLDSESMDPDPHRHVLLFKSPRFVSAPSKTLRDCARIRRAQAQAAAAEKHQQQLVHREAQRSDLAEEWNGYLLTAPRFALTIEELETETKAVLGPRPRLACAIQFLPSGDVALKARPSPDEASSAPLLAKRLDLLVRETKQPLHRALSAAGLGGGLQLARFDDSLNVLRRETDSVAGGGWSQVAAKAAAPRRTLAAPRADGANRNGAFTVLANLASRKRAAAETERRARELDGAKGRAEAEVVDDWETAMAEEEGSAAVVAAPAAGAESAAVLAPVGEVVVLDREEAVEDGGLRDGARVDGVEAAQRPPSSAPLEE